MTTTDDTGTVTQAHPANSPEFAALCKKHNVQPTRRQYSKFTHGYGALARATGQSTRKAPPGPGWLERMQIEAAQEIKAAQANRERQEYAKNH